MLDLIMLFKTSQPIFIFAVGFISLIIGSFLNVMIARIPKILQKEWLKQCYEFLETKIPAKEANELQQSTLLKELFTQRSCCPRCKTKITFYDNIPLLSYLLLGGKCRACAKPISLQYPIIEALSAILGVLVALRFGVSWQTVAGCFFSYVIIVQATIDLQHTIIPDEITLPMIWIGLILSLFTVFVDSTQAIVGTIFGYLLLWIVYWFFYFFTKKEEGMGYGDFKFLAMLGAWLGWQMLPFIILFSSIVGSIVGIALIFIQGKKHIIRIPFGPFLALAGWIALMWGPEINAWYAHFTGIY